jgi:hypothetical protein
MALQLQRPTRPMRTEPRMPHGGNALSRHDGVRGASVSSRSAAHAPPRRAPLLSIPVQAQSARRPHLISRRYHIQYISNIRMHPASARPMCSMGIGEPGTTPLSKCGQGFAGKRSISRVRSASKRFRQDRGRRPEGQNLGKSAVPPYCCGPPQCSQRRLEVRRPGVDRWRVHRRVGLNDFFLEQLVDAAERPLAADRNVNTTFVRGTVSRCSGAGRLRRRRRRSMRLAVRSGSPEQRDWR